MLKNHIIFFTGCTHLHHRGMDQVYHLHIISELVSYCLPCLRFKKRPKKRPAKRCAGTKPQGTIFTQVKVHMQLSRSSTNSKAKLLLQSCRMKSYASLQLMRSEDALQKVWRIQSIGSSGRNSLCSVYLPITLPYSKKKRSAAYVDLTRLIQPTQLHWCANTTFPFSIHTH